MSIVEQDAKDINNKDSVAYRISQCDNCEHLKKPIKVCRKCGCFMPAKIRLRRAHCPIGKWDAVTEWDKLPQPSDIPEEMKDSEIYKQALSKMGAPEE